MLMDLKFPSKCACGWASHPWSLQVSFTRQYTCCEFNNHYTLSIRILTHQICILYSSASTLGLWRRSLVPHSPSSASLYSGGSRIYPGGAPTYNFVNFPENCMKSKEFGRRGEGGVHPSHPLDPPLFYAIQAMFIRSQKKIFGVSYTGIGVSFS